MELIEQGVGFEIYDLGSGWTLEIDVVDGDMAMFVIDPEGDEIEVQSTDLKKIWTSHPGTEV